MEVVQKKLLFHALRPQLEIVEVSPEARAQYFSLGGTELSLAALRGEQDMVQVLLESGAVDVPDCLGVTAVYQALTCRCQVEVKKPRKRLQRSGAPSAG